jgi:thiosulfate dehydrogenase
VHRHLAAQRIRAARTAAGESGHALGTATRKPVSGAERYGRLDNILRNVITGSASVLIWANGIASAEPVTIDLTRWTPPDIATVGDDPFGKLVKYGHALFTDTANEIGPAVLDPEQRFSGNNLTCQNCHLQAGTQPYAMPMIGVWGQFPQYRGREGAVDTLEERINGCMERSMNGRALPVDSREMKAFSSYLRWLSTGVPDGAKLLGAGTLRVKEPDRAADPGRGAAIYARVCAACHGADVSGQRAQQGLGYQFPPLWGRDSYNNGAGMSRLLTAAGYALHNMPLGTRFDSPLLRDDEAYDVAAYIVTQSRPEKANVEKDYPIRLEKPIDSPYGPYADGFPPEQHRLGPFGPIRAKVKEIASESGRANAGGPDDGSHRADDMR